MTTEDRITKLEAQIGQLHGELAELRKQLAETQIDQWQGRIEGLEVQMHLGAMEASDRLTALMDQLRNKWADARAAARGKRLDGVQRGEHGARRTRECLRGSP